MSVYVDELKYYPKKGLWCHLLADTLPELESFARKLNLSPSWFQPHSFPHYDLRSGKRLLAVRLGAIEITDEKLVSLIRKEQDDYNLQTD